MVIASMVYTSSTDRTKPVNTKLFNWLLSRGNQASYLFVRQSLFKQQLEQLDPQIIQMKGLGTEPKSETFIQLYKLVQMALERKESESMTDN